MRYEAEEGLVCGVDCLGEYLVEAGEDLVEICEGILACEGRYIWYIVLECIDTNNEKTTVSNPILSRPTGH